MKMVWLLLNNCSMNILKISRYHIAIFYSYRDISRYRRYRLKTISRQHWLQIDGAAARVGVYASAINIQYINIIGQKKGGGGGGGGQLPPCPPRLRGPCTYSILPYVPHFVPHTLSLCMHLYHYSSFNLTCSHN